MVAHRVGQLIATNTGSLAWGDQRDGELAVISPVTLHRKGHRLVTRKEQQQSHQRTLDLPYRFGVASLAVTYLHRHARRSTTHDGVIHQ